MLARYFTRYDLDSQQWLLNGPGTARARLLTYFERWAARHNSGEGACQQACLAVKLSAEVADLSESMREVLVAGMQRIELRLSQAVLAGQQDGSLSPKLQPLPVAQSLYQLWVGAELMAKVQRAPAPLQRALLQTAVWLEQPGI